MITIQRTAIKRKIRELVDKSRTGICSGADGDNKKKKLINNNNKKRCSLESHSKLIRKSFSCSGLTGSVISDYRLRPLPAPQLLVIYTTYIKEPCLESYTSISLYSRTLNIEPDISKDVRI